MFGRKLNRQQAGMVARLLDEALFPLVESRSGTVVKLKYGDVDIAKEENKKLFTEYIQKYLVSGTLESNAERFKQISGRLTSEADACDGDKRLVIHAAVACAGCLCKVEIAARAACQFPKDTGLNQMVFKGMTATLGLLDELLGVQVQDQFNSETASLLKVMPASQAVFDRIMWK